MKEQRMVVLMVEWRVALMAYYLVASTDYCWVGMSAEPLVEVMDGKKAAMTEMKTVGEMGMKSVE